MKIILHIAVAMLVLFKAACLLFLEGDTFAFVIAILFVFVLCRLAATESKVAELEREKELVA